MLTASRLTRQMSLPMAELLHVLSIVTTRKFMMAAQVAVVGVWRPRLLRVSQPCRHHWRICGRFSLDSRVEVLSSFLIGNLQILGWVLIA